MTGADPRQAVPVRVLVLSAARSQPVPDLGGAAVEVTVAVLDGGSSPRPGAVARARRAVRRLTLTVGLPLTRRVPPGPLWRYLRVDAPVAPALDSHVVVSTDAPLDRQARLAARLSGGAIVVPHDEAGAVLPRLAAFRTLLDQVDALVRGGTDRTAPDTAVVAGLRAAAADLLETCPAPLVPVDLVAARARSWVGLLHPQGSAELVADAFAGLPWPQPGAGASGLEARLEWARISTDPTPDEDLTRVRRAAARAAEGSRLAAESDRFDLALDRWDDAWELLYHRELHTDVPSSPLVDDPRGWLEPLLDGPVHRALAGEAAPRRSRPGPVREQPRVMVVSSRLGDFHSEVVSALEPVAEVETVDLSEQFTRLRRRGRASRAGLDDVVALAGLASGPEQRRLAARVRRAAVPYDVVFSDWADASTVWLSRTRPPGVRLVVRVHSVDALHPWFPLVDWTAVDEVVVIAPALRSLVLDLLAALGVHDLPVTLLPGLVAVDALDPGKDAGARHVLGMTGWSRRVKDVAWALDLLELDPRWRLLLVGQPLQTGPGTARARAYVEGTLERMHRPGLAERIEVVGWTDDVASQLRRVGVMLSTSRREGNHHGLVEGAASGAVPVVRNWPIFAARGGARAVYPDEWVVDTVEEAAARIHATTADDATWQRARMAAREQALSMFDPQRAAELYRRAVLGPRAVTAGGRLGAAADPA